MSTVKFFINQREPDAVQLANQMRNVGINFTSLPTSGPATIWIDGHANYGMTAVKFAIHRLIESEANCNQDGAVRLG